jgi:hypothetical protein
LRNRTRCLGALGVALGVLFWLSSSSIASASPIGTSKRFGIGGMLGQPTGFTLKYFFTKEHALTGAVGLGWWGGPNFHVHVDYGYHFELTRQPAFDLKLYVGGGLKFFVFYYRDYRPYWSDDPDRYYYDGRAGLGLRFPVGIAFNLNRVPLEIFGELAPGVAFLPWLDFIADGSVGVRYYF